MKCGIRPRSVTVFLNQLSHPRGIAVFRDKLFYVDVDFEAIFAVPLISPGNRKQVVKSNIVMLHGLKIYRQLHQEGTFVLNIRLWYMYVYLHILQLYVYISQCTYM